MGRKMIKENKWKIILKKYYKELLYVGTVSIADIVLFIMSNHTLEEGVVVLYTFIFLSLYMLIIIMSKEEEK